MTTVEAQNSTQTSFRKDPSYRLSSEDIKNSLHQSEFANIGARRQGKVRDLYDANDKLVFVISDRLSAFDRFVANIPYKGQILDDISDWWFEQTKDIIANHRVSHPAKNVTIAKKCKALPIEIIVRGSITGSLWKLYKKGDKTIWEKDGDFSLAQGLKEFDAFPEALLTPTTKPETGHDEPISAKEILKQGIVSEELWNEIATKSKALFERGRKIAAERGLILVDTKYEFGLDENGALVLIDEIHTPDSSRYWQADTFEQRIAEGKSPEKFDKDVVRDYLSERLENPGDDELPDIPDEHIIKTAETYICAYEQIIGKNFEPNKEPLTEDLIQQALKKVS